MSTPNRSRKPLNTASGSGSPPEQTSRSDEKCSGVALLVLSSAPSIEGIATKAVGLCSCIRLSIRLGMNRAVYTTLQPAVSGTSVSTVRPKEWNCGSTPSTTSLRLNSTHSMLWLAFSARFPLVSMTPLGRPEVPEV